MFEQEIIRLLIKLSDVGIVSPVFCFLLFSTELIKRHLRIISVNRSTLLSSALTNVQPDDCIALFNGKYTSSAFSNTIQSGMKLTNNKNILAHNLQNQNLKTIN